MPMNWSGRRKALYHVLLPLIVLSTCCARFAHTVEYSDSCLLDEYAMSETAKTAQSPPLHGEHGAPETTADAALKLPATTKATIMTIIAYEKSHTSGWKCCCWNATNQNERECRCEGDALTRVPETLPMPVQRLTIASAGLQRLRSGGLKVYAASLLDIVMTDLQLLGSIEDSAFAGLKLLRTINISHAPQLIFLSKDVFQGVSDTIKTIRIINSGLTIIPELSHLSPANKLKMLDFGNNHITRIAMKSIRVKTDQLILANNDISYIDDSAFYGSQIAKLILKGNRNLREVHPNAFSGMSMQELDLSNTSLVRLPSAGLQDIMELRIENTHTLKTIPSIYNLKNLQRAYLTHSFHCCAFKFPLRHEPRRHADRMEKTRKHNVACYPMPNAFNPCEEVMGSQWLHIAAWIVISLAMVGNVATLVVLLSIKSENLSVPLFLLSHLAFADLCLVLYLMLIAAIDVHTRGEYFNYAYDWQYGACCKVAGFLTVFGSLLTVFTLTVITIERWMAIAHAMNLRSAAYIMICGWIYSLVMSTLPLFGINNYSATSICLPMEIRDLFDVVYLVAVLGLNGVAFFIIALLKIRSVQAVHA